MVHEAVNWEPISQRWIFLPRRGMGDHFRFDNRLLVSTEKYDADTEGEKGSNKMLIASADFSHVEVETIGEHIATHGFSSFKFVPHRHHEIVALKTVEHEDIVETCILFFLIGF